MRIHHILLGLLGSATVAAQPVMQPSQCDVTISRAPDEVRDAIEAWVHAEPRCATTLDVRVVPTEGGFYLFARDPAGRVRERVVPDAQSAGVLVASWVADDQVQPMPPVPDEPPAPVTPVAAPSTTPVIVPAGVATAATTTPGRGRWLTLGGIVQLGDGLHGEGGRGVRAELDLRHYGKWTLGAVLAVASSRLELGGLLGDDYVTGSVGIVDVRALAQVSRSMSIGRLWNVGLALGGGLVVTHARAELESESFGATSGVSPTAEASLLITRKIGDTWALVAGPTLTYFEQEYRVYGSQGGMLLVQRKDVEVLAFGGFRFRL